MHRPSHFPAPPQPLHVATASGAGGHPGGRPGGAQACWVPRKTLRSTLLDIERLRLPYRPQLALARPSPYVSTPHRGPGLIPAIVTAQIKRCRSCTASGLSPSDCVMRSSGGAGAPQPICEHAAPSVGPQPGEPHLHPPPAGPGAAPVRQTHGAQGAQKNPKR